MDKRHQNCSPTVPSVAPSATSSICQDNGHKITNCSLFNTSVSYSSIEKYSGDRGQLLGIVRPAWRKVQESEMRLDWLNKMVKKNLVVRDIEAYAKALCAGCPTWGEQSLAGLIGAKTSGYRSSHDPEITLTLRWSQPEKSNHWIWWCHNDIWWHTMI